QQLSLDVVARPNYFPVLGRAISRHFGTSGVPSGGFPGLRRFAWGGERVRIDRLSVPAELEDTELTLVAGPSMSYELQDEDGRTLLRGVVAKAAASEDGSAKTEVFVSELKANPGTQFHLVKRPFVEVVAKLQKSLEVRERNRQSGIIEITLK